jgi:hypothetical protein
MSLLLLFPGASTSGIVLLPANIIEATLTATSQARSLAATVQDRTVTATSQQRTTEFSG